MEHACSKLQCVRNSDWYANNAFRKDIDLNNDKFLLWFLSYCFKFRETKYQHMPYFLETRCGFTVDPNNYFAFFGTDEFSDWAFTHHKKNLFKDLTIPINYKIDWKNVIIEAIKTTLDKDRILQMPKGFSLKCPHITCNFSPISSYGIDKVLVEDNKILKIENIGGK